MDYMKESLACHKEWKGKIEVVSRVPVDSKEALSLAYTPGVAKPCLEIEKDPDLSYELTRRHNLCAVITDGTAVLGLGDIGPEAGMPVMEGKCVLFKSFGNVDAFPLCTLAFHHYLRRLAGFQGVKVGIDALRAEIVGKGVFSALIKEIGESAFFHM